MEQTHPAQVEHHLGHAAGHEHLHGRMIDRPVGKRVHQARRHPVDPLPVLHRGPPESGGVRQRGDVKKKVRRSSKRRMHQHRILDRVLR